MFFYRQQAKIMIKCRLDFLDKIYEKIKESNADIIVYGCRRISEKTGERNYGTRGGNRISTWKCKV